VSRIILLDSGPLGLVTNPRNSADTFECNRWLRLLLAAGTRVLVPEIADYEVRRELLRGNKAAGIKRLDALKATIGYVPLTTEAMLRAAEFWAQARQRGRPTADNKALDGDVILAAQAALLAEQGDDVTVATTNVGHLTQFVDARAWQDIV